MPNFRFFDDGDFLGQGVDVAAHVSVPRALYLLAIASAPSPGSRYHPNPHWAALKYATVVDPRGSLAAARLAIANAGISDLDPHQKTVLADDFGVALGLARIDALHGIVGLADCYVLRKLGQLVLSTDGGHRRMPDFLLLLSKPINGSALALLECKGSTRSNAAPSQLNSACVQLENVSTIFGIDCKKKPIPKIGMAVAVHAGQAISVSTGDPPEVVETPPDVEIQLRANYIALELAALGDLSGAEKVRSSYDLPNWAQYGVRAASLPRSENLSIDQTLFTVLPPFKRLSKLLAANLDSDAARKQCLTRVRFVAESAPLTRAVLEDPADHSRILSAVSAARPSAVDVLQHKNDQAGRRLWSEEIDRTALGSAIRMTMETWPAEQ
jgi:hypothetical protein